MTNRVKIFAIAIGLGTAGFITAFAVNRDAAAREAVRQGNSMEWLRAEFKLDPVAFGAISKLHEDFSKTCDEHCRQILAAKDRKAPQAEIDALAAKCVAAMKAHFNQVAALMPASQGQRYLDLVLPLVDDYDHRDSPTLGVN